jgi:hypothetical protein
MAREPDAITRGLEQYTMAQIADAKHTLHRPTAVPRFEPDVVLRDMALPGIPGDLFWTASMRPTPALQSSV